MVRKGEEAGGRPLHGTMGGGMGGQPTGTGKSSNNAKTLPWPYGGAHVRHTARAGLGRVCQGLLQGCRTTMTLAPLTR